MNTDTNPGQQLTLTAILAQTQQVAPKRRRHLYWASGLLTALVICLGAGIAMAYTFWYQQPDKIISDTFFNALSARTTSFTGTVDAASGNGKLKTDLDGAVADNLVAVHSKSALTSGAINMTIDSSLQTGADGAAYVKLANARDLAAFLVQLTGGSGGGVSGVVDKVDDKWVKVTSEDMGDATLAGAALETRCLLQATNTLQTDATVRQEVIDLYAQHQFIVVKQSLGEQNGSLGYKLTANQEQAKAFIVGLRDTQLYGIMRSCDGNFMLDEHAIVGNMSAINDFEVWSSKFDHQLTAINVIGKTPAGGEVTIVVKPVFNKPVSIAAPEHAMSFDELRQDVQALMMPR